VLSIALVSCEGGISYTDSGDDSIVPNTISYAPVAGSPNAVQEGAEGYCGADGLIQANHDGYSGRGFVNTENVLGAAVRWQVSVPNAGDYAVIIRYANGASSARNGLLSSAVDSAEFTMQVTGGWSKWSTVSKNISLKSGSNRITLSAGTSSGLPNIDSIEIVGGNGADCSGSVSSVSQSDAVGNTSSNESPASSSSSATSATSATSNGSLIIQEDRGFCDVDGLVESVNRGFRGDGYANTDNSKGTEIEWRVEVPSANNFEVNIRYANGSDSARSGTLVVNGNSGSGVVYDFQTTGGWGSWGTDTQNIVLQRGSNKITVKALGANGLPNIDSIAFLGSGVSAGRCDDVSADSGASNNNPDVGSGGTAGGNSGTGSPATGRGSEVTRTNGRWLSRVNGTTVYNGNRYFDAINAAIDASGSSVINIRNSGESGSDGGEVYAIRPMAGQTLNFNGNQINANGGELVVPVYCDRQDNITVKNLVVKGSPRYGIWFRGCSNATLENISMELSIRSSNPVGLGIRVDASTGAARNLTIKGNIDIDGSKTHGIETYSVNGFDIGDVTVTNTGGSGLLLNDSRDGTVGNVLGRNNNPDGGYATFRVANNNGPNVYVESVYSRNSGRGFFSVSGSRGTTIDRVDIADSGKQGIFLEDASDTTVRSGRVSNGNPNCQLVRTRSSSVNVSGC